MNPEVASGLIKLLGGSNGKIIQKVLTSGDPTAVTGILAALGVTSPTTTDIQNAQELAKAMQSATSSVKNEEIGSLRNIMVDSPQKLAIKAAISAAEEGTRIAGDISRNNANRLATALLSANRRGTNKHDEVFGKSITDKATDIWAQNKLRKGENLGRIFDGIGNAISKTFGLYNSADSARKAAELGRTLGGAPGSIFNYMQSQNTRLNKLGI